MRSHSGVRVPCSASTAAASLHSSHAPGTLLRRVVEPRYPRSRCRQNSGRGNDVSPRSPYNFDNDPAPVRTAALYPWEPSRYCLPTSVRSDPNTSGVNGHVPAQEDLSAEKRQPGNHVLVPRNASEARPDTPRRRDTIQVNEDRKVHLTLWRNPTRRSFLIQEHPKFMYL